MDACVREKMLKESAAEEESIKRRLTGERNIKERERKTETFE